MPGFGGLRSDSDRLSDTQIAELSNYVLSQFGRAGEVVSLADAAQERAGGPSSPLVLLARIGIAVAVVALLVGNRTASLSVSLQANSRSLRIIKRCLADFVPTSRIGPRTGPSRVWVWSGRDCRRRVSIVGWMQASSVTRDTTRIPLSPSSPIFRRPN